MRKNEPIVLDREGRPFVPLPEGKGVTRYRRPGCGVILFFVLVAWGLEIFDFIFPVQLDALGVRPREVGGLIGVLTMPWLHGDFGHLLSNTLTFIVLGYLVLATEKQRFYSTSLAIIVLSGLGTWLIARPGTVHIGASGLIYGYFGYLTTRAFMERRVLWTLLGIVLVLLYGGMLWGVLPQAQGRISWEGHLCGFVAGIWLARRNVKEARLYGA